VSGAGRLATVVHLILALAGWILFGVFWLQVFYRTPPEDSAVGVLVVGVLLVVSFSLTVAWIRHNIILSRQYGNRRSSVREATADWSHDKLGRSIAAPSWETLQEAAQIEIDLDTRSDRKIYRAF
jgi:hypothetical protein